jgi:signal transduction histidine kinase
MAMDDSAEHYSSLGQFLRRRTVQVVRAWNEALRDSSSGSGTSSGAELVPVMLGHLADAIEHGDTSSRPLKGTANEYAVQRLQAGCDLPQVLSELRVLRRVIAEQYAAAVAQSDTSFSAIIVALDRMHDALDRGTSNAVEQYNSEVEHAREVVVGILSHDLRQPLHAIRVAADVLTGLGTHENERVRRIGALIAASASRADDLISDLLEVARASGGGGLPIVPQPVDVSRLLCAVADEVRLAHPGRTVEYRDELLGGSQAECDGTRVAEAVSNLLTNAMVHGTDPVTVAARNEGDLVIIEVRSQGEVARDMLPRMFDPFTSGAGRLDSNHVGLGLYAVKQIAAAHRGFVHARSTDGTTTVAFAVPRKSRPGKSVSTGISAAPERQA